ncbi:MAG: hypothetical protein VX474_02705 [Pseudomonadota bacterium]|nr:hypothetical protein [Pseudomonadota bacterium]MEE2748858.1 hypothetical protein [Pseudomonadota bacterium]
MTEMMITRAVKLIGSSAADAESSLKCMSDDLEKLRLCTAALTHLKERQIVKKTHTKIIAKHARAAIKVLEA